MDFTRLLVEVAVLSPVPFEIDFVEASAPEALRALRRVE